MKNALNFCILVTLLTLFSQHAYADVITDGAVSITEYVQQIGLAICGLFGVIGAVVMSYSSDTGSRMISYSLFSAAGIFGVPVIIKTIGSFF